jgi:hypothetical protein
MNERVWNIYGAYNCAARINDQPAYCRMRLNYKERKTGIFIDGNEIVQTWQADTPSPSNVNPEDLSYILKIYSHGEPCLPVTEERVECMVSQPEIPSNVIPFPEADWEPDEYEVAVRY